MFGFRVGFPAELSFLPYGLHTRTAVARNPCVSWAFLSNLKTDCTVPNMWSLYSINIVVDLDY